MSDYTATASGSRAGVALAEPPDALPTHPCSVVWSQGHAYVLEGTTGRTRWVGIDERGRPHSLTHADIARRGWSATRRV